MKNILMATVALSMLTTTTTAFADANYTLTISMVDREIKCFESWGFKRVPVNFSRIPDLGTYTIYEDSEARHLRYNSKYKPRLTKCANKS